MTTRVRLIADRLEEACIAAESRGLDLAQPCAWVLLGDPSPNRGTVIRVVPETSASMRRGDLFSAAAIMERAAEPGYHIELWPAEDAAELEVGERAWRRA